MSNTKISALTSATTPLAGTETLPVVQSSTTKQVSVANLTAGRSVSVGNLTVTTAATTALGSANINSTDPTLRYKVTGGTADKNTYEWRAIAAGAGFDYFQLRKINDAQTVFTELFQFTNDGNLVPSTAAKGINFTANSAAAGKTSQLLNWYEEGTFTPVISDAQTGGNTATFTGNGNYTRIGRQVTVYFQVDGITTTGMTAGNSVWFGDFPYTSAANNYAFGAFYTYRVGGGSGQSASVFLGTSTKRARIFIYTGNSATADTTLKISDLVSGTSSVYFSLTYWV